jgi:DNA-binding response OmpR family regulator
MIRKLQTVPLYDVPVEGPFESRDVQRPIILIVDDEVNVADTLSLIMAKNGFAVFTAYDPESAIEMANLVPPDVLLSEIVFARTTGLNLARAVRSIAPACKILFLTRSGAAAGLLLDEAREIGLDFLEMTKPLAPIELLAQTWRNLGMEQKRAHIIPMDRGAALASLSTSY